jgi:hypothetical protein
MRAEFGVGLDYSVGEYGEATETTIIEVPFTARLSWDRLSLRVRLPYVMIEGPGGVVPGEFGDQDNQGRDDDDDDDDDGEGGGGGAPGGGTTTLAPVDASGLGDISLSAAYSLDLSKSAYLDLIGRVSLPTGDEAEDLGRGETDYTLGAEIGRTNDAGGLYAYGGWKNRGGERREDGGEGAVGGFVRLGSGRSAGAEVNFAESARADGEASASATLFASQRMGDAMRLSGYLEAGLSDNAPDLGAGVKVSVKTDMRRPFQRQ